MAAINILSPHVADLIAAGEVVERPASIVKELIENSFDAGAKNVTCEIRNGGATFIRVTDDGCGMSPEDAGIAFERHATSKLHDEFGLESIATMGFRGEALAAISSVSRIELITRRRGDSAGTRLTLEAGEIQDMDAFGCPDGTTMIVRDLFYNTPARLKFMKSDRSESSACINAALRCALGRPDVSVRFIRDGSDEFFSPGDGRIDSCLYSLLGRSEASGMLECSSSSDDLKLSGFISSPSDCRGNRAHQYFFVNGRFIRSVLLQTALEQAYRNTLLSGRYPSCVLYLELSFSGVDVNVHPAKTEVRFGNEKSIFDFVYHSVQFALEEENTLASSESKTYVSLSTSSQPVSASPSKGPSSVSSASSGSSLLFKSPVADYGLQLSITPPEEEKKPFEHSAQKAEKPLISSGFSPYVEKNVENSVQNVEKSFEANHKILGEAFRTYIIVEQNGEIFLIDKHAAHERMIFDRLCSLEVIPSVQMLLSPATVTLSPEDAELLCANGELLASLGYEIEPYGEREFIVRGVPAEMFPEDAAASIDEICEQLRSGSSPDPAAAREEVLHTVACKAAIKAGWDTQGPELEKIVSAVLSGEIRYCPHGRPVSVTITRKDLDKLFKRIV